MAIDWKSIEKEVAIEIADLLDLYADELDGREDGIDIRLQVLNGEYQLHTSDSCYDTDHRGLWGAGILMEDTDAANLAEELVGEAMDQELEESATVATETPAVEKEVVPELLRLADDGCPNVPSPPLPPTENP